MKWFKKNQTLIVTDDTALDVVSSDFNVTESSTNDRLPAKKRRLFDRFAKGLSKTRGQVGNGIARLLLGKKEIDTDCLETLETLLLSADVGMEVTEELLKRLRDELPRQALADDNALLMTLQAQMKALLAPLARPMDDMSKYKPFVILMVGVNGAGKTTTIGKLAKQYLQAGKSVMLAAGDTFRAAAVEQLQAWGDRNGVPVIAQHTGADSASVIYDAFQAAKARKVDVLIADTAGRLHAKIGLMEELKKVKRVMQKLDSDAPHEIMLVLDAGTGQNGLNQAKAFHQAVGLTGITMTKLDGTAKGGILFAIANELGIPFRYLGLGESIDDLQPFEADQFVGAMFHDDTV